MLSLLCLLLLSMNCVCFGRAADGVVKEEMAALRSRLITLEQREQSDVAHLTRLVQELRSEMNERCPTPLARELEGRLAAGATEATGTTDRMDEKPAPIADHGSHQKVSAWGEKSCKPMVARLRNETRALRNKTRAVTRQVQLLAEQVMHLAARNATTACAVMCPRPQTRETRRVRHSRVIRRRIFELMQWKSKAQAYEANVRGAIAELVRRIDRCETAFQHDTGDAAVLAEQVDVIKAQLLNLTATVGDANKMHVSMLELLENLQNVESKMDKTLPEFRKEISKLGANMAQVNSHISYNREDTENLRQSVKAIAFSISSAIDKAALDRQMLKKINESIVALQELSKRHSHRLWDHVLKSEGVTDEAGPSTVVALPELMGEVKELQSMQKEYEELVRQLPSDCSEVAGPAGSYVIAPRPAAPLDAWCAAGRTLLQRRYDGSVDFNVKYAAYAEPFGTTDGEFWIGLENMHALTRDNCSTMRVDMKDIYGAAWHAEYSQFAVGPAESGYRLAVGGFSGNASDAFLFHQRMEFSAADRDRDTSRSDCAANYEGGWWFSRCQHVNLNGKYSAGLTWFDAAHNAWIAVASSEITLARKPDCESPNSTLRDL